MKLIIRQNILLLRHHYRFHRKLLLVEMTARPISTKYLEYTEHGNPVEVLKLKQRELTVTNPTQVLAKVLASPINPADINMVQGTYGIKPEFPAIGGSEGVAEILEAGGDVRDLAPGDWVIGARPSVGFWSTHILADRDAFVKVRKDIPVAAAATLAVNPCTAYRMLHDFVTLQPNDVMVQNGANGAVGQGVIQLAKSVGVISINIIRDRPNLDEMKSFLKSLGADYVVTEEEFKNRATMDPIYRAKGKPKLALNCVGGQATMYLTIALDERGKLVSYGGMSKQPLQVPVGPLIFKYVELHGFWISKWKADPVNKGKWMQMLDHLTDLIKSGRYLTPECERVTLENYGSAMKKSMEGFAKKQMFDFSLTGQ